MGGVDRDFMSVLVTGSDGFIGQNLVLALDKMGLDVTRVDNRPKTRLTVNLNVAHKKFVKYFADINNKYKTVFHLASPCSIIQFNRFPRYCVETTIKGFEHTLQLAKLWDAKLIYPSSGNVYGSQPLAHNEKQVPKPINLYGSCKLYCEKLAANAEPETVGLRVYAGYGPFEEQKGQIASVVYLFLRDMLKSRSPIIWGDGTQTRDFIYIDDVIKGLVYSMVLKGSGIINLGTGKATSYNEVVETINNVLDTSITPKYIEKPLNYVNDACADTTLMKKLLLLNPRSLETGITQFLKHFGRNKK